MDAGTRNELIDRYYAAIDDEAFDRFRDVFTDDVEYLYPGEAPMYDVEAVITYFRDEREHSDSTHEVQRRVADDEATVCEGTITAVAVDGAEFEAGFVGVFEFDDDAEAIDRVGVYVRR